MGSREEDIDDEPLCPSTIQFLADNGFINPAYDPASGLRAALRGLQNDWDDEEVDELTDDVNDDEVARIVEPQGINPQQVALTAQPIGSSNTLVDEAKTMIAATRLPAEKWTEGEHSHKPGVNHNPSLTCSCYIEDTPKAPLRFDGPDELVMTRKTLKDTPIITTTRKSTFKPLIAKSHKAEAQEALKSIKLPDASSADDTPAIKPIDACLKLGLAASVSHRFTQYLKVGIDLTRTYIPQRQLYTKTQSVLASVQSVMKRESGSIAQDDTLMQEDLKVRIQLFSFQLYTISKPLFFLHPTVNSAAFTCTVPSRPKCHACHKESLTGTEAGCTKPAAVNFGPSGYSFLARNDRPDQRHR